jgi:hypothetical protein
MVSVLASSDWSWIVGQSKDYKFGICCFPAKHTALMSKDWLARNQDNVSKVSGMSTRGLLFQWASKIKIGLVQMGPHHYLTDS